MQRHIFIAFTIVFSFSTWAQQSLEKALERFNTGSVPYITVEELEKESNLILLDTRKGEEFEVSHLRNAKWVGFREFDLKKVQTEIPNTETPLVVYCSIGVRSEKIGEKLQKAGYTNVKNLYGGIFEWKNQGLTVVDSLDNPTERVHAYSKYWGQLLTKGHKVYTSKKEKLENQ